MIHINVFKRSVLFTLLIILLVLFFIAGISLGAVSIPTVEIMKIMVSLIPGVNNQGLVPEYETIITTMRLPRVVIVAMVGAGLALAGATFQGLFRNPMADPYVIGVSSGASLGAVCSMLFQAVLNIPLHYGIPVFAFSFAIITILLVYNLARVGGKVPVMTLLLAGMAVSALLSALVSLCMFFSGDQLHKIVFWMMGGFSGRGWNYVFMFLPYAVLGAMTFPAILFSTGNIVASALGGAFALFLAYHDQEMIKVAIGGIAVAYICQLWLGF